MHSFILLLSLQVNSWQVDKRHLKTLWIPAPVGPAAGYLVVKEGDYDTDIYKIAFDKLADIGVDSSLQYPDTCPVQR